MATAEQLTEKQRRAYAAHIAHRLQQSCRCERVPEAFLELLP